MQNENTITLYMPICAIWAADGWEPVLEEGGFLCFSPPKLSTFTIPIVTQLGHPTFKLQSLCWGKDPLVLESSQLIIRCTVWKRPINTELKSQVLAVLHSIVMRLSSLRIKDQGLWTEDWGLKILKNWNILTTCATQPDPKKAKIYGWWILHKLVITF